jgi:hypothetical protein
MSPAITDLPRLICVTVAVPPRRWDWGEALHAARRKGMTSTHGISAQPIIGRRQTRIFDMKKCLKCSLTIAALATAVLGSCAPVFARGGAASIMNSPGYQRRLQESRQQVSQPQVSQPDVQPASVHRGHKPRHHHRH